MTTGRLVYVMGPSGAGKDTVLRLARPLCGLDVLFARRTITRAPVPGDEDFEPVDAAEFERRLAAGDFAMHWRAHGFRYGIGFEVDALVAHGGIAVVSGSRAHFAAEVAARDDVLPILVTARAPLLAARLASRGREDRAAIERRRKRGESVTVVDWRLLTIVNDGSPDEAARRLAAAINRSRAAAVA